MPGRLRASFRSGNLAEHLGLLLLRDIAAVADVPRTEDVGIDAIATLLRDGEDGNFYAEDSFVVQLKSDSEKSIEYKDHQVRWLLAQTQPMFVGVVSRKDARVSLYPTLHVNQAALALNNPTEITVRFGKAESVFPWAGSKTGSAIVWLGPPLLSWTVAQMGDSALSGLAYKALKRFLGIARREYELLSLGQTSNLAWSMNEPDSIRSSPWTVKTNPRDLQAVVDQCIPSLKALLFQAQAHAVPEDRGGALAESLLAVLTSLRDLGANIDASTTWLAEAFAAPPPIKMPRSVDAEDAT